MEFLNAHPYLSFFAFVIAAYLAAELVARMWLITIIPFMRCECKEKQWNKVKDKINGKDDSPAH